MVRYFKKLYIIYSIVVISGILATGYFTAPMSWNIQKIISFWSRVPWVGQSGTRMLICALVFYIVSLVIVMLIVMAIFEFKALMLLNTKDRILCDDLELQKFLDEFSPVFQRAVKINRHGILKPLGALTVITSYSQGLFEAGRSDEAIKILEDEVKKSRRKSEYVLTEKCGAYYTLCMFYYQLGEPDKLARCSTEVKNLSARIKRKRYKRNLRLYEKRVAAFNHLYSGSYDKAIEFYSQVLKKGKSNLERTRAHCRLAEAYAAINSPEQSKAHLQIALEMGPELFTVKETQGHLQNKDDNAANCSNEL